jgi:virginiamycin B lyase
MRKILTAVAAAMLFTGIGHASADLPMKEFQLPAGSRPHDVAPAPDGGVWYTAQRHGALGRLDPATGKVEQIPLGSGSAPHGVIVGPDGAPWITDGGLNAIVRVDPVTRKVTRYPLPAGTGNANLNTAAFDGSGVLWFTGQNGIYGRLAPASGDIEVFKAPEGRGPYGIRRRRTVISTMPRSRGATSRGSIPRRAMLRSSNRRPTIRVPAASGRTAEARSGSASGTAGR